MGALKTVTVTLGIVIGIAVLAAAGAEVKTLTFDRAALHAQAVEESLKPVRPGIPGKRTFWNSRGRAFMYAPAFDFKPVEGAKAYRFTVTSYEKSWSFVSKEAVPSLKPIWNDLPEGKLMLEISPPKNKTGLININKELDQIRYQSFAKETGKAPAIDFRKVKDATGYRFAVRLPRDHVFEADEPWAPLTPIWKELSVGRAVLKVEGLDRKGGKIVGLARIGKSRMRIFRRKAVFNGPYHEAVLDYTQAAHRWLSWLSNNAFNRWTKEGNPESLQKYPCKYEASAVAGLALLATLEIDPAKKEEALQKARNAARTLIKGSFPADWGLGGFPPTYGGRRKKGGGRDYGTVMMKYPSTAANAYLDLYEVTKEKEFLDAVVRIAEVYKKTQLPNGTWHLLMEGKSGEKTPRSRTYVMPFGPISLSERLVERHGLREYVSMADAAWRWLEQGPIAAFRFEGQFEDTGAGGGSAWNLSHWPAYGAAGYLFRHADKDPSYVGLAEEILRFAEDQFIIWEQPPNDRQITPCVLEQYKFMVSIQFGAAGSMDVYWDAYEATGKEIYLAKAVAFANAITVLQKKSGGYAVSVFWLLGSRIGKSWPNCHVHSAGRLAEFGEMLRKRNLRVPVNAGADTEVKP